MAYFATIVYQSIPTHTEDLRCTAKIPGIRCTEVLIFPSHQMEYFHLDWSTPTHIEKKWLMGNSKNMRVYSEKEYFPFH